MVVNGAAVLAWRIAPASRSNSAVSDGLGWPRRLSCCGTSRMADVFRPRNPSVRSSAWNTLLMAVVASCPGRAWWRPAPEWVLAFDSVLAALAVAVSVAVSVLLAGLLLRDRAQHGE